MSETDTYPITSDTVQNCLDLIKAEAIHEGIVKLAKKAIGTNGPVWVFLPLGLKPACWPDSLCLCIAASYVLFTPFTDTSFAMKRTLPEFPNFMQLEYLDPVINATSDGGVMERLKNLAKQTTI